MKKLNNFYEDIIFIKYFFMIISPTIRKWLFSD